MTFIGARQVGKKVASGDRVRTSDHNELVSGMRRFAGDPGVVSDDAAPSNGTLLEIVSLDNPNARLVCKPVGGDGTDSLEVLLPPLYTELSRPFPAGTVTYVYTDINTRTASGAAGPNETQLLTPPILAGEIIATEWSDANVAYVMLGDGRMWGVDPP